MIEAKVKPEKAGKAYVRTVDLLNEKSERKKKQTHQKWRGSQRGKYGNLEEKMKKKNEEKGIYALVEFFSDAYLISFFVFLYSYSPYIPFYSYFFYTQHIFLSFIVDHTPTKNVLHFFCFFTHILLYFFFLPLVICLFFSMFFPRRFFYPLSSAILFDRHFLLSLTEVTHIWPDFIDVKCPDFKKNLFQSESYVEKDIATFLLKT